MDTKLVEKAIARRVLNGGNPTEAKSLFEKIITTETGASLILDLCWFNFTTELQAEKLIASMTPEDHAARRELTGDELHR